MNLHRKKGFTLFEMMVSIAIFVTITTIAVLNYRKFGNDVFINNLAYDVALSVRKAQSYGINVRGTGGSSANFTYAYGMHFTTSPNNQYTLFVDSSPLPPDQKYTNTGEDIETYTLLKNSRVVGLCVILSTGGNDCVPAQVIDITFLRPNPDAQIYYETSSSSGGPVGVKSAKVTIQSSDGKQKEIVVYNIGQISVQ